MNHVDARSRQAGASAYVTWWIVGGFCAAAERPRRQARTSDPKKAGWGGGSDVRQREARPPPTRSCAALPHHNASQQMRGVLSLRAQTPPSPNTTHKSTMHFIRNARVERHHCRYGHAATSYVRDEPSQQHMSQRVITLIAEAAHVATQSHARCIPHFRSARPQVFESQRVKNSERADARGGRVALAYIASVSHMRAVGTTCCRAARCVDVVVDCAHAAGR